MSALIDTSFLLALVFPKDIHHQEARSAMRNLRETRLIAAPVLPEFFYMAATRMNYSSAVEAFGYVRSKVFQIEDLSDIDMKRMEIIMRQYDDNQFDYVDASIMTLAERLMIADIYTFDRRDFTTFRPVHRPYLRLLP